MNKIFSLIFIFAFSSWSMSSLSIRLVTEDYVALYKLTPSMLNGQLFGTVVAKTEANGECKGNFVINNAGTLHIFFNGPQVVGRKGNCAYESSIITLGDQGFSILTAGEIDRTIEVKFESCFFNDDFVRNGKLTLQRIPTG